MIEQTAYEKGKAYYELALYQEGISLFEEALTLNAEDIKARFYLAHSYIKLHMMEQARYHLQFMSKTTEGKWQALGLHALACLEGGEREFESARRLFDELDEDCLNDRARARLYYNQAQAYLHLHDEQSSLDKLIELYKLEPHNWHAPYLIGHIYLNQGDEVAGFSFWFEAMQLHQGRELLTEIAKGCELRHYHKMAALCYERCIKMRFADHDPDIWFGLAWNYGMSDQVNQSMSTFLKGMSLFPFSLPIQVGYVWMLFYTQQPQEGYQHLELLVRLSGKEPLVQVLQRIVAGELEQAGQLLLEIMN
jgi:tetratricopeptide (TPR) repeat protein